jgi:hypothetical protein
VPPVTFPPTTAKQVAKIAALVLVAVCVLFFGYQYFFRHTLDPWSVSDQIYFHGREYRGGAEVSPTYVTRWAPVRAGLAPWPDRAVYTAPPAPVSDADPTGIVVYTLDHKYRSYGLVGGP